MKKLFYTRERFDFQTKMGQTHSILNWRNSRCGSDEQQNKYRKKNLRRLKLFECLYPIYTYVYKLKCVITYTMNRINVSASRQLPTKLLRELSNVPKD